VRASHVHLKERKGGGGVARTRSRERDTKKRKFRVCHHGSLERGGGGGGCIGGEASKSGATYKIFFFNVWYSRRKQNYGYIKCGYRQVTGEEKRWPGVRERVEGGRKGGGDGGAERGMKILLSHTNALTCTQTYI